MTWRADSPTRDRSAVSLLLVSAMALGLLGALAVGTLGGAAVEAERAQAVADVSALAGAVAGEESARTVAAANGATVVGFRLASSGSGAAPLSQRVVVDVRRSRAVATAAASSVHGTR